MTLEEAKALLSKNGISFELREFQSEAEYWRHTTLFPYTRNAKPCKVIAIIIQSKNAKKNIELQFNAVDDNYHFEELYFGEYGYEEFDVGEEYLADDLLEQIYEIKSGSFIVISVNDIRKKRWLGDVCFDLSDDPVFGKSGLEKAVERIQKPKGFLARMLKSVKQYEIYDWNTYRCIIK